MAKLPASTSQTSSKAAVKKGAKAPDPKAMERYMRGSADPQGQQDFESATSGGKVSPDEAGYQQSPAHCSVCANMQPDGSCSKIDLPQVDPGGYCSLFDGGDSGSDEMEENMQQPATAAPQMAVGGQGGPTNG